MCGGGGLLGCTCPIQTLSNPPLALVHGQLLRTDLFAFLVGGAVPFLPYRWPPICVARGHGDGE